MERKFLELLKKNIASRKGRFEERSLGVVRGKKGKGGKVEEITIRGGEA